MAVKTLSFRAPNMLQKFIEETNLMKKFCHPNIVSLLGKTFDVHYIVNRNRMKINEFIYCRTSIFRNLGLAQNGLVPECVWAMKSRYHGHRHKFLRSCMHRHPCALNLHCCLSTKWADRGVVDPFDYPSCSVIRPA